MAEYIEKKELVNRLKMWLIDLENDMDKGDYGELCENKGAREAVESCICEVEEQPLADVQPIVYAHKTINVGRRSYCSNCGKLAIMEDFCSKCGAKVKDGEPTRNLTDEETEIYESWIDHEAKDTGVNIMDGDINGY